MRSRALSLYGTTMPGQYNIQAMATTVLAHRSLGKAKQCPQRSMLYWIKAAMWSMVIITSTLHDLGEGKNVF